MVVAQVKRVTQPAWLNSRTVLGVVLFCVAFLSAHRYLEGGRATVPVWAVARDVPQESTLSESDLRLVEVRLPSDVIDSYVPREGDLTGAVALRTFRAGELIPRAWIADASTGIVGRSITLPVAPEHAIGGDLKVGDRIDVFATFDAGGPGARTVLIARSVEILRVVTSGAAMIGEEALTGVTVAVSEDEAARLAFAVRTSELDLVKVLGAPGTTSVPSVTQGDIP